MKDRRRRFVGRDVEVLVEGLSKKPHLNRADHVDAFWGSAVVRMQQRYIVWAVVFLVMVAGVVCFSWGCDGSRGPELCGPGSEAGAGFVRVSEDGGRFVVGEGGERFVVWGFNYDHDDSGELLEDYWYEEWSRVVEDFQEMKVLGANVVRIHLQMGRFMTGAEEPNERALGQLGRLVELAEQTGLYLDITGLGCYHKADVPEWYDAMDEARR